MTSTIQGRSQHTRVTGDALLQKKRENQIKREDQNKTTFEKQVFGTPKKSEVTKRGA